MLSVPTSEPESPAVAQGPSSEWALAHLSDLHLSDPLLDPAATLAGKQLLGRTSWHKRRRHIHKLAVLDALSADLLAQAPSQIAISGDLVQIGLAQEFEQAARWLSRFAPASQVVLVPGNHEAYAAGTWQRGRDHWGPYLAQPPDGEPWLLRRGRLALIGLSSAVPSWPGMATGTLGKGQLAALEAALVQGAQEQRFRVVVVHHPPAGVVSWRKRLTDQRQFAAIIARHGAGVILHGHTHCATLSSLRGPSGPVPVVGVPSASALDPRPGRMAGYGLLNITSSDEGWKLRLGRRVYRPQTQDCGWLEHCQLPTQG